MLVLVVAAWAAAIGWATVAAVRAAAATEPTHPIVLLAQTRTACRIVGIDQAGEVARLRVVDLSAEALRCVLGRLQAPEFVWLDVIRTWPLDGRRSTTWGKGTLRAEWFRNAEHHLDVTVRALPAAAPAAAP